MRVSSECRVYAQKNDYKHHIMLDIINIFIYSTTLFSDEMTGKMSKQNHLCLFTFICVEIFEPT